MHWSARFLNLSMQFPFVESIDELKLMIREKIDYSNDANTETLPTTTEESLRSSEVEAAIYRIL